MLATKYFSSVCKTHRPLLLLTPYSTNKLTKNMQVFAF